MPRVALACLLLVPVALVLAGDGDDAAARYDRDVRPLLVKYCVGCHDDETREADLSLERFGDVDAVRGARRTFGEVLDRLESGEMPPDGEPAPPSAAREAAVRALRIALADAPAPGSPGRVTARRLNRAEYDNTIRDLLGVELELSKDFPADDLGYGFDNIADVLSMSPLLADRYLTAAEKALDAALVMEEPKLRETHRFAGSGLSSTSGGRAAGDAHILFSNGAVYVDHTFPADGKYVLEVWAYGQQAGPDPARMAIRLGGVELAEVDVVAVRAAPGHHRFPVAAKAGRQRVEAAFVNDYYRPQDPDPTQRDRNLFIESVGIDGPLGVSPKPKPDSHRRVFFCAPSRGLPEIECARRILRRFATRAFRRPVSSKETARLLALYRSERAAGSSFERSVALPLQAVLVSPYFLYRIERDRGAGIRELSGFELASRLSYFLWSSMPDDELAALAAADGLGRDRVLDAEVRRMLADEKAQALVARFGAQWLELPGLDAATPDPDRFPSFSEGLRASMRRETELFLETVIREDRSILEFIDSDWTWIDGRLAAHYGIEGVEGGEFRRVRIEDRARGGLLTQASILTITSNPTRTSPVKRGKWILEQILDAAPPPPPADIPPLPDDARAEAGASLRERLARHREDPSCAACHETMDPLGLAFENFDAVGRWREKDGAFPVDASGKLPDGSTFDGPAELKRILLGRRDEFARAFAARMLTFALGRGLEDHDEPALARIVSEARAGGYRFSSVVLAVVRSDPFRKREGGI